MFLFNLVVIVGVILSVASMPCRDCTDATVDSEIDYKAFPLAEEKERDCMEELLYCLSSMSPADSSRADDKYNKNKSHCLTLEWCQKKNAKLYGGNELAEVLAPLFSKKKPKN